MTDRSLLILDSSTAATDLTASRLNLHHRRCAESRYPATSHPSSYRAHTRRRPRRHLLRQDPQPSSARLGLAPRSIEALNADNPLRRRPAQRA